MFLKQVYRGFVGAFFASNLFVGGVFLKDGRARKAEELGLGEKFLDGLVVVAKLRAVTFIEDEDDALEAERFQPFFVVAFFPLRAAGLYLLMPRPVHSRRF